MILTVLLVQAAVSPTASPDIHLQARVRAKSVRIERKGTSYLRLTTEPDGGNTTDVQAPPIDRVAREVTVTIDAKARIADPASVPR